MPDTLYTQEEQLLKDIYDLLAGGGATPSLAQVCAVDNAASAQILDLYQGTVYNDAATVFQAGFGYAAKMTQSSTNDPFVNTLAYDPFSIGSGWTRTGVGTYKIDHLGNFNGNFSATIVQPSGKIVQMVTDNNYMYLNTFSSFGTPADNVLSDSFVYFLQF